MEAAIATGFEKDPKDGYRNEFKNSMTKVYMKSEDCGNLDIPEVHPVASFKGGQKYSR